ncbi:MAG: hypothetical protein AAGI28_09610 [Pseudomonadota bacterium]
MTYRASLLACAGLVASVANPALAAVDEYSIEPAERLLINLDVCSPESQLAVRGKSGTDLDFELNAPDGTTLLSDAGIDDYFSLILSHDGDECGQFKLSVSNLGEEQNDITVVLEPVVASSTRVKKYIIQGSTTETFDFRACGTAARVKARGDGDTDLDFIIRNSDGGIVHEDAGASDATAAKLTGLLSDCEKFEIEVTNLGDIYNAMMLVVEPEGADTSEFVGTAPSTSLAATLAGDAGADAVRDVSAEKSGPGDYIAEGSTRLTLDLPICGTKRLEVRGSGESDLDFSVSDSAGDEVHSDVDLSDITFKTLEGGEACETFSLAVNNLGETDNPFEVVVIDPATRVGEIGEGEYLINANASTKVPLQVCSATKISASGGGETDLDFDVTDASGSSVHSDYDLTDATEFTLDPKGECKDYQISINNLGADKNMLTIAFGKEGAGVDPRKREGPFVAGPTRPTSGIAPPGQIVGFRKGPGAPGAELNRNISLLNNTGEALTGLFWSNSATMAWGEDRLAGNSLASGQQWNVQAIDGSGACLFDFRAIMQNGRQIVVSQVNVCEASSVTFE